MRFSTLALGTIAFLAANPAMAQEETAPPKPITITGSVTAITDYRFRGATQTNGDPAIQGTLNVNHSSGFYVGTFLSSIDGGADGSTPALTNYGDVEVDLYGGFTKTLPSGLGFDVGLLYYWYADGAKSVNTDFFEPYASVNYTVGPANLKVGGNYAWGGQKGLNFTPGNDDSLYLYGEASVAIPKTPITLKGHFGRTKGSLGLLNPTIADDSYLDWSLTAEAVGGPLKVGVSYVDTDITNGVVPGIGHYAHELGRGSTVLGYVAFSF
ncbi:TorF family putative porin [Sphingomonas cannabina]|uniref:TorF family putative porin n=1 Tax=Sphingomonas cannabina TaxID=2899123 RepID=UPI001F1AA9D0|nr:TorF family putative porin [Sphingomonas cannabina]UIJ45383.1 TorF family putative porin [Sphingomonas cannabina]